MIPRFERAEKTGTALGGAAALVIAMASAPSGLRATTQTGSLSWGLDAVDQRGGTDGSFHYDATGEGVNIYVIDSGVRRTHQEFREASGRSRVTWVGAFCAGDSPDAGAVETVPDDGYDGHGTHNASFAAGVRYGVAKRAHIFSLRASGPEGGACADGNPTATTRAINWITAHGLRPAVVNVSFAFASRAELNEAILGSIAAGFTYTLSGHTGGPVEHYWGTEVPQKAFVVGGVDRRFRSLGTDRGSSLAIWAPAEGLTAAGAASDADYSVPETCCGLGAGDSLAAPFVAGVAALYLQGNPQASPTDVRDAIISAATPNLVTGLGGSPNRFLYSRLSVCSYALSETSVSLSSAAATRALNVVPSIGDCEWTARSSAPWLTVAAGTHIGTGSVQYQVVENATGVARVAALTIGNGLVVNDRSASDTITQLGNRNPRLHNADRQR